MDITRFPYLTFEGQCEEAVNTYKDIFEKLSQVGHVMMPPQKQFWGAWVGQVTDRFGIRWMINCQE